MLSNSEWLKYLRREHDDFYLAMLRQRSACFQQGIRVCIDGRYETPKEKYRVSVNDGNWLIFHPRRKGGKRVHINNMKKNYRKCIRSYASFLRADGIDNADEMRYYILHYTFWHISFNRMLKKITYDKTSPIIDEVIKWIMKKEISEVDKTEFIDPRKIAAPDEICNGAIRKARKSEKIKLTKQVQRKLTDKEIAEKYNPDLTDKENAANINIGLTRLKEWKKEYINSIESKEDRVKRLYDPSLSWAKNEEIIGYSINTIKKYLKMREPIAVDLGTPELETADSENQITECLDIDNNELLTDNAEIIAPSPDTIKTHIKIDCETTDDENLFDEDNAELIRWVNDFKFEDEVDMEMDIECQDIDSDESIEHLVKMEEPIAIDVRAAELETEECENLFDGKIDLENDDFCRWMFGDEFMEEIERERKRNALIYGTEEVVKMVV